MPTGTRRWIRRASGLGALGWLSVARPARAVEPGAPQALPPPPPPAETRPPPPASAPVSEPPPGPEPEPAAPVGAERRHDGFYLRLALGPGYGDARIATDRVSQPDQSLSAGGGGGDLMMGGKIGTGLTLGGSVSWLTLSTASAEVGDATVSARASHAMLAAFLDAYPDPSAGFHFGGLAGFSSLRFSSDDETAQDYQGSGFAFAVFAGYDAWIGRSWCLGGLLRLGGGGTRRQETIADVSVTRQGTAFGGVLMATLLYH